jgi:hypothetical protein
MADSHRVRWSKEGHERGVRFRAGYTHSDFTPKDEWGFRPDWKKALARVRYRNWELGLDRRGLTILGATQGGPGTLAMHGPFAIPEDAEAEAIIAVAVDAIVAVEGEWARPLIEILPAR